MDLPTRIKITRCSSGGIEIAAIHTLNREDAKNLIDAVWWNDLGSTISDTNDEPDRKWNWRQLVSVYRNKPYFHAVCVLSDDGSIQAAMLYRVNALSVLEPGKQSVFVERLAVAPRNRDHLAEDPLFRGGGTGLIVYAAALSYSLGFAGRINLCPVANCDFYSRRGFVETATIADDEVLFGLPSGRALNLLRERGLIDG